jgi:hypothetical protein
MIRVHTEDHEVACESIHAAGVLEVRLLVPDSWPTSQRLDLANILARGVEEVRIGCTNFFSVSGEVVAWEEGQILIRLARRRVAWRMPFSDPSPLEKDVQVLLSGKDSEFRYILESMIQIGTDTPPPLMHSLLHQTLFKEPPSPPEGWEATTRQRCCARFVKASGDRHLVVMMGIDHESKKGSDISPRSTKWMPFLYVVKTNKKGIPLGRTILWGSSLLEDPLYLHSEDWLMKACELAHVLVDGYHHGEIVWEWNEPRLRFGERMFRNLEDLARWIQNK